MSALKRVAGVSLYHQIMEDLREEIQGMAYGEQIETEQQLAEKYAVSRGTVRQAITALVSEGLLTKIQGKGTFKSGVALDRSTAVVKSFTDQLLASGLVPGIRDVNLESDFADERTAKHLGLAPGTPIWAALPREAGGRGADLLLYGVHQPGLRDGPLRGRP